MRNILYLFFLMTNCCFAQRQKTVITQDVSNFWNAYDKIILTADSLVQLEIINSLYISKGTPGLTGIMQARRYTAQEYIAAIKKYPQFWNSIRKNTLRADEFAIKIEKGILQLRKIYPDIKPAKIYFTIGILRTNGTVWENNVLIGSELAMADKNTISKEFDNKYPYLRTSFDTNPIKNLDFLNVHEYIHTQQKSSIGKTLLAQTVLEGVAEFIAVKALNMQSPNPQITYGKTIESKLKTAFVKNMFTADFSNWLWNSPDNEYGMRDLAYFLGYAISEKYYNLAKNKKQAIKEMIQLDYNNETELFKFVDETKYFDKPLKNLQNEFEQKRPVVTKIEQFENGSQNVNANIKKITLLFSEPMDIKSTDFDYGPLGKNNVLWPQKIIGFSSNKLSFSFEINMEPGKRYQLLINEVFKSENGFSVKPYLIDFTTVK